MRVLCFLQFVIFVKNMHILVLGGNGYLGSKIIKQLALERQNTIVFTKRVSSNLGRLKGFLDDVDKIKAIPASIEAVETAMSYGKFDLILNMACSYGRKNMLYNNVIEANIEFPLRVLNSAVEKGTKRFMTIGTGLPDELNMYSFTKKMFSDFGRYYSTYYDIDFYNMKLEMFYGADEPRERFVPNLIEKMLSGTEVNVTKGTQHRDIISVEDVIHAIFMVINSKLKGYNEIPVGTGIAPAISELVDFIWEETGRLSKVNKGSIPMRKNEPDCVADVKVLESIGEWHPVNWQIGIKEMIKKVKYYNENIN